MHGLSPLQADHAMHAEGVAWSASAGKEVPYTHIKGPGGWVTTRSGRRTRSRRLQEEALSARPLQIDGVSGSQLTQHWGRRNPTGVTETPVWGATQKLGTVPNFEPDGFLQIMRLCFRLGFGRKRGH